MLYKIQHARSGVVLHGARPGWLNNTDIKCYGSSTHSERNGLKYSEYKHVALFVITCTERYAFVHSMSQTVTSARPCNFLGRFNASTPASVRCTDLQFFRYCQPQCTVGTFNSSHPYGLGALHGRIANHIPPTSLPCTDLQFFTSCRARSTVRTYN